jgi:hypothetical protein
MQLALISVNEASFVFCDLCGKSDEELKCKIFLGRVAPFKCICEKCVQQCSQLLQEMK